jgi:hypothetical protein
MDYDSRNEKGFEFDKYTKRCIKRHDDLIMDELCVLGSNKVQPNYWEQIEPTWILSY